MICLSLFFGSHLLVNLADWTEILLFLLGIALIFIDLFFIMGFGLLAIPGALLILLGLFLSLMGRFELWTWGDINAVLIPMFSSLVLTSILAFFILRSLPDSRMWRRVVLDTEEKASAGYVAAPYDDLLGASGTAFTDLRPGGTGLFKERRISVSTEGDYLTKDTPITVVEVEGSRVIVRRVKDS